MKEDESTALIKSTPRERMLAEVQKWEAEIRAQKTQEIKNEYSKTFVKLCNELINGTSNSKLNQLTLEELAELNELVSKKAMPYAIATFLFLPTLPLISMALIMGIGCKFSGFISGLGWVSGILLGLLALANLISFFDPREVNFDLSWKYLWRYRRPLKKLLGKDYFPYEEVKKQLG